MPREHNLVPSFDINHKNVKFFCSSYCFDCTLLFVYCSSFVLTLILFQRYKKFTKDKLDTTKLKYHIWNRCYGISHEGPLFTERVLKIFISAFRATSWQIFSISFLISRNFAEYYQHAKFKSIGSSKQKLQVGHAVNELHTDFVLVLAYKASSNVIVVSKKILYREVNEGAWYKYHQ